MVKGQICNDSQMHDKAELASKADSRERAYGAERARWPTMRDFKGMEERTREGGS